MSFGFSRAACPAKREPDVAEIHYDEQLRNPKRSSAAPRR